MNDAPNILIVRVGAMGDVLHALPAVAALRAAMPEARIGWAIEPHWSPLLRTHPGVATRGPEMPLVDRVHAVPAKEWLRHPFSFATLRSIRGLRRELRWQRYDIAIDLQGSIRSSVIARMSGARQIVGSADPREKQAGWLYQQRVKTRKTNVVEQAAEMVAAAMKLPLQPVKAPLPVSKPAEQWCDALFRELPERPVVLLAPTAGWGAKEWPAVRFGYLARALEERGYTVLVNASPFGPDGAAGTVVAASQGHCRAVPCTIPQLMALVQRVALLIAGDTGPLHLAAACGVPVLGLFGPTDPLRTGPWGMRTKTLRHRLSQTDHRRHAMVERGLAEITVDEVLEAALEQLSSSARG
ncbi:glycosyltransferase family 9 protein [Terriglobus sp. RCC_193]|uniref:glycosyltransferase family 9 protein n=1 Tax=Terriglobus sp. RCC_193 TaxID=3239218 RepID=UPI00352682E9